MISWLHFPIDVVDDWPPVRLESVPVRWSSSLAGYEVLEAPLFVRDVSVGDILAVSLDDEERVVEFRHLLRSSNSTIWLLRLDRTRADVYPLLEALRQLGCHTVRAETLSCYAVSVPHDLPMAAVDAILSQVDEAAIAVAFPSFRHPD